MPPSLLTDVEKERIRYHLGYPSSRGTAATIQLGLPALGETAWLLDRALSEPIDPNGIERVRVILLRMDEKEELLDLAADTLLVQAAGELTMRPGDPGRTATDLLEVEYARLGRRLADMFGCQPYQHSARYGGRGRAGNLPVRT